MTQRRLNERDGLPRPRIGITPDVQGDRCVVSRAYAEAVAACGGVPVVLPVLPPAEAPMLLGLCDGVIFTGGDDPIMERWGLATHPKARPVDPARQAFELALLDAACEGPDVPVLGVCLGMQYMGLRAGGTLEQHLPDRLPTADEHWGRLPHTVQGTLGSGIVHSHHRQALTDPGSLEVVARAHDGVIEAVRDPRCAFYLGVQWHPERTADEALGLSIIRSLVTAAACRLRPGAERSTPQSVARLSDVARLSEP